MLAEEVAQALKMPLIEWHIKSRLRLNRVFMSRCCNTTQRLSIRRERVKDISNYIEKGKLWEAFSAEEKVVLLVMKLIKLTLNFLRFTSRIRQNGILCL
ncbi:MAG: hypothetical protein Ct9H300mP3_00390 [Gammaproteobacteria bacterium]|nr:MAG: hypothetical protein Ct9H300mP3_00390 [Gammaproteobacteria bacterium]